MPTDKTKLTLFILYDKWLRLIEGGFAKRAKPDEWDERWDYTWSKEPAEWIKANFHDAFIVFQAGKTYYFVTQKCQIYGLEENDKKRRATVEIWDKDDQPIGRVISDNVTGKLYAFTIPLQRKDGTIAKPCYFELTAKPEPIEYDPAKFAPVKAPYPYKQIREAVDVLIAEKKINPKDYALKGKIKVEK